VHRAVPALPVHTVVAVSGGAQEEAVTGLLGRIGVRLGQLLHAGLSQFLWAAVVELDRGDGLIQRDAES